jgi:AraC-like DNA-binding protein
MDAPTHAAPGRSFDSYAKFYRESAYAAFPQEHRAGGSFGQQMMRCAQQPIDLIDAAVQDLVFLRGDDINSEVLIDVGNGATVSREGPGSITLYPPGAESRTRVQHPHAISTLAFPVRSLTPLLEGTGIAMNAFAPFFGRMREAPRASRLMNELWAVASRGAPSATLLLDGLALQLLAVTADSAALSPLGAARPEDVRIARAIDHAEAHLAEPLCVAELAGIAAMSPSRFARVFRATTGETVWGFVQRRRLERAREMLVHGREPIAGIAVACGLTDQTHMTKLFRRAYGTTPKAFRDG